VFCSTVHRVVADVKGEVLEELMSSAGDVTLIEHRYMVQAGTAVRVQIKE
jgi:hypothetical protein